MKTQLTILLALLCAASACGGSDDDGSPHGSDGGGDTPDGGDGPGTPDAGPGALTCSHTRILPKYPWGVGAGAYDAPHQVTFAVLADDVSSPFSELTFEVWPGPGGAEPSLPLDRSFSTASRYNSCDTCILMAEGCDAQGSCRTYFFPQAGEVHVNEAGRDAASGHLRATGSNLILAEWSLTTDSAVPGGRCVELEGLSVDTEWGDGGSCSGDPCGAGGACCADSPYCSLGDNNIGRFCSDFCGASGDGCAGPDDCCDGFKCFLGTCITDSCGADRCTAGLDEGGDCCGQAAYCTDGGCSAACGQAGAGCGGDLDCCTGLSCAGGSCQ